MKFDLLRIRRWILVVLVLAVFGVYIARLINVQIVQADDLRQALEVGYTQKQTVPAVRGEIVDRNGIPLVSNKQGYDVIFDFITFPKTSWNEVILRLVNLFEESGAEWIDYLPMITTTEPYVFLSGYDAETEALKNELKIASYATVENTIHHLVERYKLEDYTAEEARKIASVRYGMDLRQFSIEAPYTFASDIDMDLVLQIKEQSYRLTGVDIQENPLRSYDHGTIAPHLIGQTGQIYTEEWEGPDGYKAKGYKMNDMVGKSGAEKAFEETLRGKNGERVVYLDRDNKVVNVEETISAEAGKTVYLTIDAKLQALLQNELEKQIKNLQNNAAEGKGKEADFGAAVAIEVETGEILACATYPYYDLNTYRKDFQQLSSDEEGTPLVNRALQGLYAPGSVFKPVVGTAGLHYGVISDGSTWNCTHTYQRFMPDHKFTCMFHHGPINLERALRVSCNIFFYETGFLLGIDKVDLAAKQYGLGEPTGIELGESIGNRSNPETYEAIIGEPWVSGNVVQSSIGQLVSQFTPLQMANYCATIANRGERMKLTLVKEVRDYSRKEIVQSSTPEVVDRVYGKPEHFESIVNGMVSASGPGGTAVQTFGNYPVKVASKTGTPEANRLNSTFIAFAPADNPKIAVAVVIENGYHGYTSAPVAKAFMDAYFGYATTPSLEELEAKTQASVQERANAGPEGLESGLDSSSETSETPGQSAESESPAAEPEEGESAGESAGESDSGAPSESQEE